MSALYVKATLYFPSCDLLWLFKDQTQGFNLHIRPQKNTLTGLFLEEELVAAAKRFKASYKEDGRFFIDYHGNESKSEAPEQNLKRDSA